VLALQRAHHPFIVRLERAFQTPKFFALLLELCPTDLNRLLCEPEITNGSCPGLPPAKVAKYMGQVLLALVHLHDIESIVYRDVKPENILISDKDEAKLTDFGLAAETALVAASMTRAGTFGFLAPELHECVGAAVQAAGGTSSGVDGVSNPSTASQFNEDFLLKEKDTLKMDAYSFGVTLQLCLLGEDGGQVKEVRSKGPVMLPRFIPEVENLVLLVRPRGDEPCLFLERARVR
jgi:serine/threonine protein kinase